MLGKYSRLIAIAVVISVMSIALPCSDAFAQPRGGGDYNRGGRDQRGGDRHYYRDGRWYKHGWLGFDIAVSALAIGELIDALPPRHTTVVVANTPYYYFDNYYYRPSPYGGYIVVPPPVPSQATVMMQAAVPAPASAIAQGQPQTEGVSTINIPNSRGGYTGVILKRSGAGFIGPQGEYYSDNPTVEQLKVLYGK